jgi:hypothetical protein
VLSEDPFHESHIDSRKITNPLQVLRGCHNNSGPPDPGDNLGQILGYVPGSKP